MYLPDVIIYSQFHINQLKDLDSVSHRKAWSPLTRCCSIVQLVIAISCTFLSYLMLNNIVTLKSALEITQRHSNWYHSKTWVQFPIHLL